MQAAILDAIGDTRLHVREAATAPLAAGRVRIALHAAGLCHSDVSCMNGTIAHPVPLVPGHEGAGEVLEVGEGVTHVRRGDRVVVCWMPPCGDCGSCRRGEGHLCASGYRALAAPNFTSGDRPVFGFMGTGTFAQEAVVAAGSAVPIPDDVPYEIAALIGCGVTTGVGAVLNTARVTAGSTVVVIGCGGVGISAVQGARVAGASRILAVDPVAGRRDRALSFGATDTVAPDELSAVAKSLTGGEGFDYAFEVVGLPATLRSAYNATRRGGTVCLVGVGSADDLPDLNMSELVSKGKTIAPSFYGGDDVLRTFDTVIGLWREGRVDLENMITHRVVLGDINEALRQMHTGEALRTVITIR